MRVMHDHPELVAAMHADYFAAGAEFATANTYAIQRDRLAGTAFEDDFARLFDIALGATDRARVAHGAGRVAGSIGPLRGSYRPAAHPELATARPLYRELADHMQGRVDLVICETVSSLTQARAALQGAQAAGVPVWLAVSVDDDNGTRLRSGEAVADVIAVARDEGAAALLVNCSVVEAMPPALAALSDCPLPLGVYANAFTRINAAFTQARADVSALQARSDLGPAAYADHAEDWHARGATILGGCCETGPAHIAEIARRLAPDATRSAG
jgi:homocysteine S-methyltransferase